MAFDGNGNFSIPNTFVYNTAISETEVNQNFSQIATGLSTAICKDGQTTITANIPMSNFKFTGLASGSVATDSTNLGQVQAQAYTWCSTAGGTVDAITLTPSPAITAYAAGQEFRFVASGNNTTATTINVSGLGTKAAQLNGSALDADDIVSGKIYKAIYDGTQFQISRFSDPVTNILTTANTFTKTQTWTKGSDVASASSLTLGDGNYFDITGTTAITSIGTKGVGTVIKLHFDGALTLTHHATDLILPSGANITTAAGDEAEFVEYASGDWRCTNYSKANGQSVISAGTPYGFKGGLTLSNNTTDSDHDIDISAGACRDAANAADITLAAFTKQIDASWVAGSGNGGLSSSLTLSADTWYHVHAIIVGGSADVGFDTSVTAANLVSDHSATAYRRIGSVLTDGSSNILAFFQIGDNFYWDIDILDLSGTTSTTASNLTISTPLGVETKATLFVTIDGQSAGTVILFTNPNQSDAAPSVAGGRGSFLSNGNTQGGQVTCFTNTSSQVRHRADDGSRTLTISTIGWKDYF